MEHTPLEFRVLSSHIKGRSYVRSLRDYFLTIAQHRDSMDYTDYMYPISLTWYASTPSHFGILLFRTRQFHTTQMFHHHN